jgi:hypothetical protein
MESTVAERKARRRISDEVETEPRLDRRLATYPTDGIDVRRLRSAIQVVTISFEAASTSGMTGAAASSAASQHEEDEQQRDRNAEQPEHGPTHGAALATRHFLRRPDLDLSHIVLLRRRPIPVAPHDPANF